jgi:hypothetical protein
MTPSASVDEVIQTVARLAGIDESALSSRTWRYPVKDARIATAHLLRVNCGLSRVEAGRHIGRSDQTVSDFTARANRALSSGGPIAELIEGARSCLDRIGCDSDDSSVVTDGKGESNDHLKSRHTALPNLRAWRLVARLTQLGIADRTRISCHIVGRLERGRLASTGEIESLADALSITPEMLVGQLPVQDPEPPGRQIAVNTWVMHEVGH